MTTTSAKSVLNKLTISTNINFPAGSGTAGILRYDSSKKVLELVTGTTDTDVNCILVAGTAINTTTNAFAVAHVTSGTKDADISYMGLKNGTTGANCEIGFADNTSATIGDTGKARLFLKSDVANAKLYLIYFDGTNSRELQNWEYSDDT